MPDVDLKLLEEIFRAKVFTMLKEEGKIDDDIIKKLTGWRHSGFSVHNKARVAKNDDKGRIALAQYIIRNAFSLEKLTCNQATGTVLYRSKLSRGKNKKNFQVYTAEEFIAAITQHTCLSADRSLKNHFRPVLNLLKYGALLWLVLK